MQSAVYRALRMDGKGWVEGTYSLSVSRNSVKHLISSQGDWSDLFTQKQYEIDRDTLCRWTGFLDNQGHKIFDKDVVCSNSVNARVFWDDVSESFKLCYGKHIPYRNFTKEISDTCSVIGSCVDSLSGTEKGDVL